MNANRSFTEIQRNFKKFINYNIYKEIKFNILFKNQSLTNLFKKKMETTLIELWKFVDYMNVQMNCRQNTIALFFQ